MAWSLVSRSYECPTACPARGEQYRPSPAARRANQPAVAAVAAASQYGDAAVVQGHYSAVATNGIAHAPVVQEPVVQESVAVTTNGQATPPTQAPVVQPALAVANPTAQNGEATPLPKEFQLPSDIQAQTPPELTLYQQSHEKSVYDLKAEG